jgi:hypothetical protein
VDWSGTGLVAVFVRDRLGGPPAFTAPTRRNEVQIADPALPRKSRSSDRNQINRNRRLGFETRTIPGPESAPARAGFREVYAQTMRRAEADPHYFFSAEWFDAILGEPCTWLLETTAPEGGIAAAAIVVRSDGMLHYFLSGTADEHLRQAPSKNTIDTAIELAEAEGLPLNLGGGMTPGDSLESFKRGFANRTDRFLTHEIVCRPDEYARLSAGRETEHFPAYRAGV